VTRDELIRETRRLIEQGERLAIEPSLSVLQDWIARSDRLLSDAWGTMDRWHLAWLMVGRPGDAPRGRPMTRAEEDAYVRAVAGAKTAVLRASLDDVARGTMPRIEGDA
jgi:hypothetical protein